MYSVIFYNIFLCYVILSLQEWEKKNPQPSGREQRAQMDFLAKAQRTAKANASSREGERERVCPMTCRLRPSETSPSTRPCFSAFRGLRWYWVYAGSLSKTIFSVPCQITPLDDNRFLNLFKSILCKRKEGNNWNKLFQWCAHYLMMSHKLEKRPKQLGELREPLFLDWNI